MQRGGGGSGKRCAAGMSTHRLDVLLKYRARSPPRTNPRHRASGKEYLNSFRRIYVYIYTPHHGFMEHPKVRCNILSSRSLKYYARIYKYVRIAALLLY